MRGIISLLVFLVASPSFAGPIERALESRWRGAWVIVTLELRSNCNASHTNNRINGRLAHSRGRLVFPEGELAQVSGLDVKRSRVDVLIALFEPRLVPHQEGPFTLYDKLECRVELEVEVPRDQVREKDITAIDEALLEVMDRHESFAAAQDSDLWNGRRCEDFPEDYDQTLHAHAIWKVEQFNERVRTRLLLAGEVLARISESISSNGDYLVGLASGVEEARQARPATECSALLRESLDHPRAKAPAAISSLPRAKQDWEHGYADGYLLVRALQLQTRLPGCFQAVPE